MQAVTADLLYSQSAILNTITNHMTNAMDHVAILLFANLLFE